MGATSDSRSVRRRYSFQLNELEQTKKIGKDSSCCECARGARANKGEQDRASTECQLGLLHCARRVGGTPKKQLATKRVQPSPD